MFFALVSIVRSYRSVIFSFSRHLLLYERLELTRYMEIKRFSNLFNLGCMC